MRRPGTTTDHDRRDRDVSETAQEHADWRCHLGHHHYLVQQDDNPEMRGQSYLECSRCGKKKDPPSYGPMSPGALGGGLIRGAPE